MTDTNPLARIPHDLTGSAHHGEPAVLLVGTRIALVGTYTGDVEITPRLTPDGDDVAATILVPPCSCEDPNRDVDPDCKRHYPEPPADLVALAAKAVAASRHWSYRAGMGPHIDGCNDMDVNAAEAVLAVLLGPGRHGVFPVQQ